MDEILDDFFVHLLRVTIRRFSLLDRSLFAHGKILSVWLTIYGARRREDNALHIVFRHQLEQIDEAHEVVLVVFKGLLHGFTDSLRSCKVDNTLDARVFLEYTFESRKVAAVHLFKSRTHATNFFDTFHNFSL